MVSSNHKVLLFKINLQELTSCLPPIYLSLIANLNTKRQNLPSNFSNTQNLLRSDSNVNFKPLNLFDFDWKGNVHTFLQLFEHSMEGASDYEKASNVINCLDTASIDLVMPHLLSIKWTYLQAKTALLRI